MYYKYHLAASNSQQQENNGVTDANWKLLTEKKKTKKTNKNASVSYSSFLFQ